MNILVIGSGGREHALVWKLKQSEQVTTVFCAPGNAGIRAMATCVDIASDDIPGLLAFALEQQVDLTIVGPEDPLTKGIVDIFEEQGLRIFGPNSKGAVLEGSKVFTKDFLKKTPYSQRPIPDFHQKGRGQEIHQKDRRAVRGQGRRACRW